jgi:hypothetical protein
MGLGAFEWWVAAVYGGRFAEVKKVTDGKTHDNNNKTTSAATTDRQTNTFSTPRRKSTERH